MARNTSKIKNDRKSVIGIYFVESNHLSLLCLIQTMSYRHKYAKRSVRSNEVLTANDINKVVL